MNTINTPMSRLQKVVHLLKIADKLGILEDSFFDILMDKSEQHKLYFEYFIETINLHIIEKQAIESTKESFLVLIDSNTMGEAFSKSIELSLTRGIEYE